MTPLPTTFDIFVVDAFDSTSESVMNNNIYIYIYGTLTRNLLDIRHDDRFMNIDLAIRLKSAVNDNLSCSHIRFVTYPNSWSVTFDFLSSKMLESIDDCFFSSSHLSTHASENRTAGNLIRCQVGPAVRVKEVRFQLGLDVLG